MKILICAGKSWGEQSVRQGYHNAAVALGHESVLWKEGSAFDMFDRFKPDILMLSLNEITWGIIKVLREYKKTGIVLWLNKKPKQKDAIFDNPQTKFTMIDTFVKENKIKDLFVCDSENFDGYYDNWCSDNSYKHYIWPAFDDIKFPVGNLITNLQCNFSYIGFYKESIKSKILDIIKNNYGIKIFGYGEWPFAEYIGAIQSPKMMADVIRSSDFNLNFSKTLNEKIFKIIGCGGIVSCSEHRKDLFPELPNFNTAKYEWPITDFYKKHTYKQRLKEVLG